MTARDLASAVPESFAAYANGRAGARFSEWLRLRAEPAWSAATRHRFTVELAEDRLDDAVFRRYLVQDYAFLETLAGLIGFAVGRAPDMAAKKVLSGFLGVITGEENTYFERAFDALGVAPAERDNPTLNPVTAAFLGLMEETGETGSYEDILALFLPAEWIYLSWATAAGDRHPARFYLAEWIDLHAVPAFRDFVGWLRGQLDLQGPALPDAGQAAVDELFRRTVDLEVAFFDAAYEPGS